MSTDYEPWSVVEDIYVPVEGPRGEVAHALVPWAASSTAERVLKTAHVVALVMLAVVEKSREKRNAKSPDAQLKRLMTATYEPPRARFRCDTCEEEWDAWVTDEGHLEDRWTAACTNGHCSRHGKAARFLD